MIELILQSTHTHSAADSFVRIFDLHSTPLLIFAEEICLSGPGVLPGHNLADCSFLLEKLIWCPACSKLAEVTALCSNCCLHCKEVSRVNVFCPLKKCNSKNNLNFIKMAAKLIVTPLFASYGDCIFLELNDGGQYVKDVANLNCR